MDGFVVRLVREDCTNGRPEFEVVTIRSDGVRMQVYRTLQAATDAYGALIGRPNLYQEALTGKAC